MPLARGSALGRYHVTTLGGGGEQGAAVQPDPAQPGRTQHRSRPRRASNEADGKEARGELRVPPFNSSEVRSYAEAGREGVDAHGGKGAS
ncbi:unnamed protein product [Lampetra planeri]